VIRVTKAMTPATPGTPATPSGSRKGDGLVPRKIRSVGSEEVINILLPLLAAVLVTGALFAITPLSGAFGFVLVAYLVFIVSTYALSAARVSRKVGADRALTVVVWSAALLVVGALGLIVWLPLSKGLKSLNLAFFTETLEKVDPGLPADQQGGGALHAIVGTLSQVGIAMLVSVPFGILTAVYLNEIKGRFAPLVRVLVDAMSGIPSIVAGLFVYAMWVIGFGQGFSGFAASLALGILMLPTVARTSEEMLKLVDPSLREASLALGSSQWRTTFQVVLPTARTGLITATILGIARVAGETAPLIMTAFGNDKVIGPIDGMSQEQSSLPLFVFQRFQQDDTQRAWGAALVLILLVVTLFLLARLLSRPRSNH
jgi:phosphate transport system permease protein